MHKVPDLIQRMPAHNPASSSSSVGHVRCRDAVSVPEILWYSNQIVDQLVKGALCNVLRGLACGSWLHAHESSSMNFLSPQEFTHAAGAFKLPDGRVLRDSNIVKSLLRDKSRRNGARSKLVKSVAHDRSEQVSLFLLQTSCNLPPVAGAEGHGMPTGSSW